MMMLQSGGGEFINYSEKVFRLSIVEGEALGRSEWARSDQARIFYYLGQSGSETERIRNLSRAAKQFDRHKIPYRSKLANIEALLISCVSSSRAQTESSAREALKIIETVETESVGISNYLNVLEILARAIGGLSTEFESRVGYEWERFWRPLLLGMEPCEGGVYYTFRRSYFLSRLSPLIKIVSHDMLFRKGKKPTPSNSMVFVSSNPIDRAILSFDQEFSEIENAHLSSKYRERIILIPRQIVNGSDILNHLNHNRPIVLHLGMHCLNSAVQVSGSDKTSIPVGFDVFERILPPFSQDLKLIFFNSCHSSGLAKQIATIMSVSIGFPGFILDEAAIRFSAQFYRSVFSGNSVICAFEHGISEIVRSVPQGDLPRIFFRADISQDQLFLV